MQSSPVNRIDMESVALLPTVRPTLTTFDVAEKITQATKTFTTKSHTAIEQLPGTRGLEFLVTPEGDRFFGISKEKQKELDFKEVKSHILQKLELNPHTPVIQIVGDSVKFTPKGTQYAKEFLEKHLKEKDQLILWGYTGQGKKGEDCYEVNQLVTNWLEEDPIRHEKALANVVDFHSVKAIRDWKCNVGIENRNFYLVHGDACFGDDVQSSDNITDVAVCLEGGIQSFRQSIIFISRDIDVHGLYNIRGSENPANYDPIDQKFLLYFSTGEFLDLLSQHLNEKFGSLDQADATAIELFKEEYLKTHHLFNPKRPDGGTKQALFDAGWKQFMDEKLWLKLDKCHFEKFMGQ